MLAFTILAVSVAVLGVLSFYILKNIEKYKFGILLLVYVAFIIEVTMLIPVTQELFFDETESELVDRYEVLKEAQAADKTINAEELKKIMEPFDMYSIVGGYVFYEHPESDFALSQLSVYINEGDGRVGSLQLVVVEESEVVEIRD